MAISSTLYTYFLVNCMRKLVSDMASGSTTVKCALLTSSYTPDMDTHASYNDASTYEVVGEGYTATGAEIGSKSLTLDTGVVTFDGADVSWAASTITARYAFIYDDTPSGATNKKAIMLVDFGENKSTVASTFQLVFSASGILTMEVG
jgi:hypothetical protein